MEKLYYILKTDLTEQEFESVAYIFDDINSNGSLVTSSGIIIYLESEIPEFTLKQIINKISDLINREVSILQASHPTEDWMKIFRDHFKPFIFADDYWVAMPNQKTQSDKTIIINPAMGFGTGKHQTTSMCADYVCELSSKANSILDVGCGSGILAILAKKEDFSVVEGVENDEVAVENAFENFGLNNLEIPIYKNIKDVNKTFDLVVANIITSVLKSISDDLWSKTSKYLVLSGILQNEEKEIVEFFSKKGKLVSSKHNGEWTALLFSIHNHH